MNDPFFDSIKAISLADSKSQATAIHNMFTNINGMDAASIMSSFQTIDFFYDQMMSELDDTAMERVDKIREAIVARMIFLCSQTPLESRRTLAEAFKQSMSFDSVREFTHTFKCAGLH